MMAAVSILRRPSNYENQVNVMEKSNIEMSWLKLVSVRRKLRIEYNAAFMKYFTAQTASTMKSERRWPIWRTQATMMYAQRVCPMV